MAVNVVTPGSVSLRARYAGRRDGPTCRQRMREWPEQDGKSWGIVIMPAMPVGNRIKVFAILDGPGCARKNPQVRHWPAPQGGAPLQVHPKSQNHYQPDSQPDSLPAVEGQGTRAGRTGVQWFQAVPIPGRPLTF